MKLAILDIETDSLDIDKANPKFTGILDLQTNEYKIFHYHQLPFGCQEYLNQYDFIITFNGEEFDLPILKNHKINIPYWKHIDLYQVFKKRAGLLRSGGFKSYSLNNIAKYIGLDIGKGKIDYKIFQKDEWTSEEFEEIKKYLELDLKLTSELWNFLIKKFNNLKEFIPPSAVKKFKHITCSPGAYAYKAICHLLNLKEEYDDIKGNTHYEGAYVMTPKQETVKGEILYFDFASLYPMMYIHANLFSPKCDCCTQEEKWHGNENFKVDGHYCSKQQGKIEKLIKELYMKRKEYKANKDDRQFAIKIILNTLYGISAKPSFKNIYNKHTAGDCTALARQCIAYAITKFEDKNYNVFYADTDSCFILLKPNQEKETCKQLAKEISIEVSNQFPFPFEEFNLKVDDEIKYIQFFKGRDGQLNKKQYIYINKDDKLKITGLDIIRKNCSKLSTKIFKDFLEKDIIKNLDCKFEKSFIDDKINKFIESDKTIIAKKFNIKPLKKYKSQTSMYYSIGKKHGEGEMFLIKNYKIGAGKKIKYCSMEESKDLDIDDLNLEDVYKELGVFIKDYNF